MRLIPARNGRIKQIFQSTHRVSDATLAVYKAMVAAKNSIHAPRERCDVDSCIPLYWLDKFQSTHRVSDATGKRRPAQFVGAFQSTHRVSDATAARGRRKLYGCISIHAPRERCDAMFTKRYLAHGHFNPRTA